VKAVVEFLKLAIFAVAAWLALRIWIEYFPETLP
jgi:hypothetical protein